MALLAGFDAGICLTNRHRVYGDDLDIRAGEEFVAIKAALQGQFVRA